MERALAIAAARGARCNQTLSFFRKAGARLTPPSPPPSSLSSATIQQVARLSSALPHPPRPSCINPSYLSSILTLALHHDPSPRGTCNCLYHSTLQFYLS